MNDIKVNKDSPYDMLLQRVEKVEQMLNEIGKMIDDSGVLSRQSEVVE